jgi:hypothetical protein
MNKIIDALLQNQRTRLIIRIALYLVILLSTAMAYKIYQSSVTISRQNQYIKQWNMLSNVVAQEEKTITDSMVNQSRAAAAQGLFLGWNSVATWLENIRAKAIDSGVNISYELEPTKQLSRFDENYSLLSVNINASPKDGKFETIMKFIENISSDSSVTVSLVKLEFTGNGNGLTNTTFKLTGCILL